MSSQTYLKVTGSHVYKGGDYYHALWDGDLTWSSVLGAIEEELEAALLATERVTEEGAPSVVGIKLSFEIVDHLPEGVDWDGP